MASAVLHISIVNCTAWCYNAVCKLHICVNFASSSFITCSRELTLLYSQYLSSFLPRQANAYFHHITCILKNTHKNCKRILNLPSTGDTLQCIKISTCCGSYRFRWTSSLCLVFRNLHFFGIYVLSRATKSEYGGLESNLWRAHVLIWLILISPYP